MSFGNELKAARESQSLSIQDVAQKTKIRGDYLRALEAEDLSVLPERTFGRAYLQSYARELHVDVAPLLRDFDRLMPMPEEQVNRLRNPSIPRKPMNTGRRVSTGLIGGVLAGVLLLGVAGYFGYSAYTSRSTLAAAAQDSSVALPSSEQVRFSLSSTPAGARVYMDNRYLGLTPVSDFPLDARPQATLRVEYGGRQKYQSAVNLSTDQKLNVTLVPLTAQQLAAQRLAAQAAAARVAQATPNAVAGTPAAGTPAAAATIPPTAAPAANGVRLSWAGAAWTRVTGPGGKVLFQGIPPKGKTLDFPPGITVRTGSAGLVTATVAGGQPQPLGAVGEVVTRSF
jgi:cytoskeleton protein RodZ